MGKFTKGAAVLLGLCAAVCIGALMKYDAGTRASTGGTTTLQTADPNSLPTPEVQQPTVAAPPARAPWQRARAAAAAEDPVYLESAGVVERLQKSRHNFISLATPGVPPRPTFRFTLEREPLVDLAYRRQTVGWPINDGGVEFVKLTTVREQDGNLFIGGEVVAGEGQFAMVMTADNSMSGQLLSPRGLYSYNSQLDEIVGQRVEGPVPLD